MIRIIDTYRAFGFQDVGSKVENVFSILQCQEKCIEQHVSFSFAFIELTKSLELLVLVSRNVLYNVLPEIGCQHLAVRLMSPSTLAYYMNGM